MKLKIFKSFFVTTSCILFVTLTLLFVIMSFAVNASIADSKRDILTRSVNSVAGLIEEDIPYNEVLTNTKTVALINEIDFFVCNGQGEIFLCSCNQFSEKESCAHADIPIDQQTLHQTDNNVNFELTTLSGRFENFRYTATRKTKVPSSDQEVYIFATATTVSAMQMLSLLFRLYAVSAIIPLLLMFFAEYFLTYRLTKPLKYMSAAAKSIAKGDFSKRVPVMSEDEIGELSVLFNRMTDSLSKNEMVRRNFISNVSHELKTPMTTISGFIDGIIDGTVEPEKQKHYLNIVSSEVKRLSRMVQSMLSIARLESDERVLNPTDFDFAELVLSVVVSMEQKITDKNLNIEGLDRLSHTVINADKDLIHQVVYNLVDNAVKYSAQGGCVSFSSHRISDRFEFSVRNDGVGISSEDMEHIFERFYKVDKSRADHKDSLGLGLYITKTIVDMHDGDISVKSGEDSYTEFKVSLPILQKSKE